MKNRVTENISRHQETVNSSVLRTSETYCPAVSPNSPGILNICHNHPSGDPTHLPEDFGSPYKRMNSRSSGVVKRIGANEELSTTERGGTPTFTWDRTVI